MAEKKTSTKTTNPELPSAAKDFTSLGVYLDGWADVAIGMGSKTGKVQKEVLKQLKDRGIYKLTVGEVAGWVKTMSNKRHYLTTERSPGVTTTIYIANYGKDLYASWRTYRRSVLNSPLFIAFLVWALGLATIGVFWEYLGGIFKTINLLSLSPTGALVISSLKRWGWITFGIFLPLLGVRLIVANDKKSKTTWRTILFIISLAAFIAWYLGDTRGLGDEIEILWDSFRGGLGRYSTSFAAWIGNTIYIWLAEMILAIIAGLLFRRDLFAYLFKDTTLFDDEDIIASNLITHSTILAALDKAGIDTTQLRIKQKFTGGRRGEDV